MVAFIRRNSLSCSFVVVSLDLDTEPWLHVGATIGGAWVANKWVKLEASMLADINEIRAYKGLPPMVGSHYFFPMVPPTLEEEPKA